MNFFDNTKYVLQRWFFCFFFGLRNTNTFNGLPNERQFVARIPIQAILFAFFLTKKDRFESIHLVELELSHQASRKN